MIRFLSRTSGFFMFDLAGIRVAAIKGAFGASRYVFYPI